MKFIVELWIVNDWVFISEHNDSQAAIHVAKGLERSGRTVRVRKE